MSAAGLISGLENPFKQEFQRRAKKYWEHRYADANEHNDEFLSVSWQGTIRYLAARHHHRAKVMAGGDATAAPNTDRILNQFGLAQPRRGFWWCLFSCFLPDEEVRSNVYEDGPYQLDCTIYYKTSHLEPDSLRRIFGLAPNGSTTPVGIVPGFAEVPLNHFYMVRREEPVRMLRPPPNVQTTGVLAISDTYFRDQSSLIKFLAREIYPKDIVRKQSGRAFCKFICKLIWSLLLLIAVGVATYYYCPPCREWMDKVYEEINPLQIAALRERIEELERELAARNEEYQEVISELDRLRQLCAAADQQPEESNSLVITTCTDDQLADLEWLEAQREELLARLAEQAELIEELRQGRGLDEPPCWPSVTENRHTPVYLFDIFADRGGLQVSASANALTRAEAEGWPVASLPRDQLLTVDAFARGAAPVYAMSRERACRHFVILREGDHDSAVQYQRQRDAVERYFYIYRP